MKSKHDTIKEIIALVSSGSADQWEKGLPHILNEYAQPDVLPLELPTNVNLPTNEETSNWFSENIDADCSASSAIYKFRVWLRVRIASSHLPSEPQRSAEVVLYSHWSKMPNIGEPCSFDEFLTLQKDEDADISNMVNASLAAMHEYRNAHTGDCHKCKELKEIIKQLTSDFALKMQEVEASDAAGRVSGNEYSLNQMRSCFNCSRMQFKHDDSYCYETFDEYIKSVKK